MKMVFRGKEDVPIETIQTPFSKNWYQDLKDVPSIALPEKALVGAGMSLCWRMNGEHKPVYMEDGKGKILGLLYTVAESVRNSEELDKMVAHLLVAARNDGYAQGYAECSHHVVNALKTRFNTLQLPIMDLINVALHSEEFMTRLREIFPDMEEGEDKDLA
ncbi:hypothetical protein Hanom_Chr00s001470g01682601 [Helianthus anomalus]